ncbi:MAG TPA: hypothetical protein VGM84_15670 [Steroidobacteraceae bacterium]
MSAIDELRSYVGQLRRRFKLAALARGTAIITAAALIATLVLVVIINEFAFSTTSLWSARALLLLTLVLGTVFGLAVPLWRLGQRWWTRRAEQAFPEFEQRLMTFADRDGKSSDPFLDLLAADTLRVARRTDLKSAAPDALLFGLFALGVVCLGSLVWLIRSGPGYLGYGAAALWTGPPREPLYEVRVSPGDATVRRHADQLVTAELRGLQREQLKIHVRYQRAAKWEETTMQPRPSASGFQFLFAGVPEDVEYFIDAGSVQSPHFHLRVADVPTVKQIRVTYHHPDWTKLPDAIEDHGGDLRAVEGTEAKLEITTDRPMSAGSLALDDGREIKLTPGAKANVYQGVIKLEKDGAYHVAARDRSEVLRISDDYFIEASPVKPPEVALVKPERDYRASPIEEVTLTAKAEDPFGLSDFALHYSVNGGPEKTLRLMKEAGAHQSSGTATIALESLKLVPGDVVAVYAAAKDARSEAKTNISFVQIEPFEREFSQSQSGGGGAGGGGNMANDQAQIAEREKEIIAATWTQNGQKSAAAKQAAEQSKFLADVQTTLRGQSLSLAGRLSMRDLQSQNEQFSSFQQEMAAAAAAMTPAAQKLSDQQWAAAVADEQKALQHLLRAEATFRQIQVAFNSRGGAGGGAVNSAGRDLASLFDLELDTQKNMYESPQTPFSANKRDQEIEDALRKLDELARRQGELAAQRQNNGEQSAEERWQQEMLRRKAEELQQQVEQLAKNSSESGQQGRSGQQGQQGQSGQPNGSQSGKGGSNGSSSSSSSGSDGSESGGGDSSQSSGVRQALNRLRQAQDDMRRAVDQHNSMDARRAADRLREAMGLLAGLQQQDVGHKLDSLGQQVADLQERQSEQSERMRQLRTTRSTASLAGRGGLPGLIDDRQKLADDLARVTRDMHAAERQADERSRTAAGKLHEALGDLETADTETRLQRSADMLRRGYAPLNDDVETQVATDLKHLRDQLGDARTAAADGKGNSDDALDTVERLRSRLAALDQSLRRNPGQGQPGGQNGQPGNPGQQAGTPGGQQGGQQPGGQQGGNGSQAGGQSGGNANGQGLVAEGQPGRGADGRLVGPVGGVAGGGGGYRGGYVDGAWNAGNNGFDPRLPHRLGPENNTIAIGPRTREAYQAGVDELNRLRHSVGEDEGARKQVDDLIRSMQRLDPKRFPGNPAMVDDLYAKVLSGVDKLELQLRHAPDQVQPGEVRSANPAPMPAGYQGAVADYFRRLSANP